MQRGATIHPRMIPGLVRSGIFPFTVRIEARSDGRTRAGGVTPGWAARSGLEAIPCTRSVAGSPGSGGLEVRGTALAVTEHNNYVISLAGHYPAISPKDRAVLSTGEIYDVVSTNLDSRSAHSVLTVRAVRPVADAGV
jgi:hypothetical protein